MEFKSEVSRDILIYVLINLCVVIVPLVLPFLALPAHMLAPLPSLFYRSKLGRQHSLNAFLITIPFVYIILGGISPSFFTLIVLISVGFVLGELFEKNLTIEATMLASCGFVVVCVAGCIFCYSLQTRISMISLLSSHIDNNIGIFLQICKDSNVSSEIIALLEQRREYISNFVMLIFPSSIIMMVIITVWINIIIAKALMLRNNVSYPNFGYLVLWCMPESVIWGLIGSSLALLIGNEFFQFIGINSLLVLMVVYFLQGIAIVTFYLVKKKTSILLRTIAYSVIFLNQFFLIVVVGIGIFDIWFNFRKIGKPN